MKKLFWILLMAMPITLIHAQDPHWSMIQWNPLYLNPANTGFAQKANRITGIYRDQWRAIPVPFSTTNISYDRRVIFNEEKGIRFGLGVQFLYDKSGDGALSQFVPQLSAAFGKYFHNNKQYLSLGIQGGLNVKTLNFSNLTFENQYNGTSYDPTLPSGETLAGENAKIPVFGFGLNFNSQLKESGTIDVGASYYNPHSPSYNFLSNSSEELPARIMAYTKADIKLGSTKRWELSPGIFFQQQRKNNETLFQTLVSYTFDTKDEVKFSIGPGYRMDDAVIGYLGMKWNDLKLGFAFDGNISDLRTATSGRGAYEVTLNYEWEKKKKDIEIKIDTSKVEVTPEPEKPKVEVKKDTVVPKIDPPKVDPPKVEPPKEDPIAKKEKEMQDLIQKLKSMLPLTLYFDNDKPKVAESTANPGLRYGETYEQYKLRRLKYVQEYGNDADAFFTGKVIKGYDQFNLAMSYVKTLLENGKSVTLDLKGFASPLAPTAYNQALSDRRTKSVENEIKNYQNGVLNSYISSGKLVIQHSPMGESTAPVNVSDNPSDSKNSVFSPSAAAERRVEVISISIK